MSITNRELHQVFKVAISICLMLVSFYWIDNAAYAGQWSVGVAKKDISPSEPVRLSGYSARTTPAGDVADPLNVRAMVLKFADTSPLVIVSIDSIGLNAKITERIHEQLFQKLVISKERIVLCATHSHTAPHLDGVLTNLFGGPLEEPENGAMIRYTDQLISSVVETVDTAFQQLRPATVEYGVGRAEFAINRRAIKDQAWVGFGTVDDGPIDRSVRVIKASDTAGKPIAIAYQYACHCTSIDPKLNQVSGDWAGISASHLEKQFPGCVALPIIGCGADANPNPRNAYEDAVAHGRSMFNAVVDTCSQPLKALPEPTNAAFSFVALASERPSRQRLEELQSSGSKHERFFAKTMLEILQVKDRIPETYPAPVHVWRFGDELAWIFLGGEVVVDYQIRLEKELSQFANVWVAAYVDDCFAYVASERVRGEGGYEVDGSMLYYNQPGRWVSGTEDNLVSRVLEIAKQKRDPDQPLGLRESLESMQIVDGWTIELVASEPLIEDPINFAFDPDGSVWVVEMGDYPSGGERSGRIKRLVDTNEDGKPDQATIFLDGLNYPTGVYPWRNGVVVACAPEVFFAIDSDGDGIADQRYPLLSGFPEGNPQHRVHGFTYGLDHRLYFGPGGGADRISEVAVGDELTRGKTVPRELHVAGYDLSLDVDRGQMRLETGVTQYIRAVDEWDNWFGNENSFPMFHYVVSAQWPYEGEASLPSRSQHLLQPPVAPPVFPISNRLDRFNDLFAANRFTSACSSIIAKSNGVGDEMRSAAIVCEPVHNLVARFAMADRGATWSANRYTEDNRSEWIRSSDPWFRPVRVENAPDGTIWIADMYRRVIEHPEWIPEEWQQRLDVRLGADRGRIYRAYQRGFQPIAVRNVARLSDIELVSLCGDGNSAVADQAQQQLIWRKEDGKLSEQAIELLRSEVAIAELPTKRLRSLANLIAMGVCSEQDWLTAMGDSDTRVVRCAVRWLFRSQSISDPLQLELSKLIRDERALRSPGLALELLMTTSYLPNPPVDGLAALINANSTDSWIVKCLPLVSSKSVDGIVIGLLDGFGKNMAIDGVSFNDDSSQKLRSVGDCIDKLIPRISDDLRESILNRIVHADRTPETRQSVRRPGWHYQLARQFSLDELSKTKVDDLVWQRLFEDANQQVVDTECLIADRLASLEFLLSRSNAESVETIQRLREVLPNEHDTAFGQVVARGLVGLGNEVALKLLDRWVDFPQRIRAAIVSELSDSPESITVLLAGLDSLVIQPEQIELPVVQKLRTIRDPDVASKIDKYFGAAPSSDRFGLVRNYSANWPPRSDRTRGMALFKQHCAKCHDGGIEERLEVLPVGPSLNALSNWTNEQWVVAVLDPDRTIEEKYRPIQMLLNDGRVVVGLKIREDSEFIECMTSESKIQRIERSEVEQQKESQSSLMPVGFERLLQPQDLGDIVAYLRGRTTN